MTAMAAALLFVLYCIEAGLFFLIVPWTRFWAVHPLLHSTDMVAALAGSGYVRGLISGFGLMHLILGIREVFRIASASRMPR